MEHEKRTKRKQKLHDFSQDQKLILICDDDDDDNQNPDS